MAIAVQVGGAGFVNTALSTASVFGALVRVVAIDGAETDTALGLATEHQARVDVRAIGIRVAATAQFTARAAQDDHEIVLFVRPNPFVAAPAPEQQ
jgi:hypothetical protein